MNVPSAGEGWLGSRDSNPDFTVQSRTSYHWTTPQADAPKRKARYYEQSGCGQDSERCRPASRCRIMPVDPDSSATLPADDLQNLEHDRVPRRCR